MEKRLAGGGGLCHLPGVVRHRAEGKSSAVTTLAGGAAIQAVVGLTALAALTWIGFT